VHIAAPRTTPGTTPQRSQEDTMKFALSVVLLCVSGLVVGCGGDDEGGSSGDATTGGTSGESCSAAHSCVNGACTCNDGPKKGQSCCDPNDSTCTQDKCDTFCRHCQ
jgi:hypothetical protein